MKIVNITLCVLLILSVSACSSGSNEPLMDSSADSSTIANTTANTADNTTVEMTAALVSPAYKGAVPFSDITTIDLDAFLAEEGLRSINAYSTLARDGKSVRLEVTGDGGAVAAIAFLDVETSVLSWFATNIASRTRLLFDANNNAVAVIGIACEVVDYTLNNNESLTDLSSLIPDNRCVSNTTRQSANGNVLIFSDYDPQTGTEYLAPNQTQYAYTFDAANLVELSIADQNTNGVALSARTQWQSLSDSFLSDNGAQLLTKMLWEGVDESGNTVRNVGAVLWETSTGESQTRGLRNDLRACTATQKVSCIPAYVYVMSYDGRVQYAEVPTEQLYDPRGDSPFISFSTRVERAENNSADSSLLTGVADAAPVATNHDGSVLLLYTQRANDAMSAGYNLYQPQTNSYVSMNRALNACPETDDSGNPIAAEDCQYTEVPFSITNAGESFTADGSHLFIRSLSRANDTADQIVESLVLDINAGAMYSVPWNFSATVDKVSADASVFIGQSDHPDYDLLIGRR